MHQVSVTIKGEANDSATVELSDAEALPVYVQLKQFLAGAKVRRKPSRKDLTRQPAEGASGGDEKRSTEDEKTDQ